MKWLVIGALFGGLPALAQQKPPTPPEGANVIAVLLPDSGAVAFERVARFLALRGYALKTQDLHALCLTTEPRTLSDASASVVVQVIVMGHTALFSGTGFYDYTISHQSKGLSYSAYSHVHFANYDYVAAGWQELETIVSTLLWKRKVVYFQHP